MVLEWESSISARASSAKASSKFVPYRSFGSLTFSDRGIAEAILFALLLNTITVWQSRASKKLFLVSMNRLYASAKNSKGVFLSKGLRFLCNDRKKDMEPLLSSKK